MRALLLTLIFATLAPAQAAPQAAPMQPAPPPPTLRSILLTQLRSTHTEEEWFVPINVAVADLTLEQARWIPKSEGGAKNPAPADHSVDMIANHLLFWNSEYLARMKGLKAPPIPDNKETFNDFDASTWPSTAVKLDAVLTEMEHLVATAADAQLAKWAPSIAHISARNAYHVGQIIYIRKLQGTWDPEKGVKQ